MSVRGGFRRWGAHPRLQPAVALLLRARTVRESGRFVRRELLSRRTTAVYRLREGGLRAVIRHRTGDVVTLGEVFHNMDYRPPPEVDAALGTPAAVLDLGANVGLFGLYALSRWPGVRLVGYEPDPANAEVHRRTIAVNGQGDRWRLKVAAAGTAAGTVSFVSGGVALSHVATAGEGDLDVPVEDVLGEIAAADLVKIDIEGAEWALLADERFRSAPPRALVMEYHPGGCPAPDPHAEVRRRLGDAGLRVNEIWSRGDGHGMLWAWR